MVSSAKSEDREEVWKAEETGYEIDVPETERAWSWEMPCDCYTAVGLVTLSERGDSPASSPACVGAWSVQKLFLISVIFLPG